MTSAVELIPLVCSRCQTPVSAQPDEVAWACAQCGQGLLLDSMKGTTPIEIHYAANLQAGKIGQPFWLAQASVELTRKVFGGGSREADMHHFWGGGRTFLIPAYKCPLDEVITLGSYLVEHLPDLTPGPPAPFLPVITLPEDVPAFAEFIVMAKEVARKDRLKELQINLKLGDAELWVLP